MTADLDDGQNPFYDDALRNHRLELVIDNVRTVYLFMRIAANDVAGQFIHALVLDFVEDAWMITRHLHLTSALNRLLGRILGLTKLVPVSLLGGVVVFGNDRQRIALAKEIPRLSTHRLDIDLPLFHEAQKLVRSLQDVGVESAGKPFVARDNDQQDILLLTGFEQRMPDLSGFRINQLNAPLQRLQHADQHLLVGPCVQRPFLGAAQFGRRDHLHGLGDLARVFHAADSPF